VWLLRHLAYASGKDADGSKDSVVVGWTVFCYKEMKIKIPKKYILLILFIIFINYCSLVFLAGTNRLVTNDEARGISAGVSHWFRGEFELANDTPPLARMSAVLPLLPLRVNSEAPGVKNGLDIRDRELRYAGRFAHINKASFNLFFLARMMGFLWWLLGAWVIFKWSCGLYGVSAGCLGSALWCAAPNVLAYEQLATAELPAVVICATATYAFRGYLSAPSWGRALVSGLLLGVAQLVGFVSLTLLVIWPLLVLVRRLTREGEPSPGAGHRTRMFQAAFVVALGLYVLNLGYGFNGCGSPLESFDFTSRALGGAQRPPGEQPPGRAVGNRFRGTWLGRAIIAVPADYLKGLDRRWRELEVAVPERDEEAWPAEIAGRSPSTVGSKVPIGLRVMMLWSFILLVSRHASNASKAEELSLWLPPAVVLSMTIQAIGPLTPAVGVLLTTPFAIIIASKLACSGRSSRWKASWFAIAFSVFYIADLLKTSYYELVTVNRVARFRQDLVRQGRKAGLTLPDQRTSAGVGAEERGLLYRTFCDSQGVVSHYALFVPEDYRGDRPYPLILFLHGYGDRGTTGRRYTEVGLPFTLKYRGIDFLVLCPQGHSGSWEATGDDARRAMELLAAVQEEYRVDPKRISLTGLSSGGAGVWQLAAQYPDRWAAIVPVAASCDPDQAPLIKDIPCWCFHNRYDGVSTVEGPRAMIKALRTLGGKPKYTEYKDTIHNAGERAYVLPELYDWLSQQRLPSHWR
jgi:predicted esterase